MSLVEKELRKDDPVWIPVFRRGKPIDRLVAAGGSMPVRTHDGMQFTDSFGAHAARTERSYRTPLTIEATVMTDSTNIVLLYAQGEVILNWDRREDLLHVRHPATGQAFDLPGRGAVPVSRWHVVEWIVAEDVMRLLVDGEERFSLPGNYRGLEGTVGIRSGWRANLSVGSLHVEEHDPAEKEELSGFRAQPHEEELTGCLLGAMRGANRYAEENALLGGIGHLFRPVGPGEAETSWVDDASAVGLLQGWGLRLERLPLRAGSGGTDAAVEEAEAFVRGALAERVAVFGRFRDGAEDRYAAVIGLGAGELRIAPPAGAVRTVRTADADALYVARPCKESDARVRTAAAFRFAASAASGAAGDGDAAAWMAAQQSGITGEGEAFAAAGEAEPMSGIAGADDAEAWSDAQKSGTAGANDAAAWTAALRSGAGDTAARRAAAERCVRGCQGIVGESLAGELEAAAAKYGEAGARWAEAAELISSGPEKAGGAIAGALAAEREGARLLGGIAEALAGIKLLEGLEYPIVSCMSPLNTITGVARYCGIEETKAWIKSASGLPFLFAMHERVNVHDICLPLPYEHMIRLCGNLGLDIGGVEGDGRDDAYDGLLAQAWDGARAAIDDGAACFGVSVDFERFEFSVIRGYDRDGYYTHGWHGPMSKPIPWRMCGLGQCPCLQCTTRRLDWRTEGPVKSVCRCDACQRRLTDGPALEPQREGQVRLYWARRAAQPGDDRAAVRGALELAVAFAETDGPWACPGMHTGTEAYDVLIRALEKGTMDGWYLGLYANGWQECKSEAAAFLKEAKKRLTKPETALERAFDAAIREAERLAEAFAKLYEMFPWMQPFGPIPDTERRYAGAELMRGARKAEAAALAAYRDVLEALAEQREEGHA